MKALCPLGPDIRAFPPGHVFVNGQFHRVTRVADLATDAPRDADAAAVELARLVEEAVERGCRSGAVSFEEGHSAPVAVFLSGGIDSSVVAAAAASRLGPDRLRSFAVETADSTDLPLARLVARHLGIRHTEQVFGEEEVREVLPDVIYHLESFDAPLVRSSVANYLVGRMAAEAGCRLALCGEGGDELFAGYSYLKTLQPRRRVAKELVTLLEGGHANGFQRVDRMTAAHGLEARVPLSAPDLVAFAMGVPLDWKIHPESGQEKWLLRQAFHDRLPQAVVERPGPAERRPAPNRAPAAPGQVFLPAPPKSTSPPARAALARAGRERGEEVGGRMMAIGGSRTPEAGPQDGPAETVISGALVRLRDRRPADFDDMVRWTRPDQAWQEWDAPWEPVQPLEDTPSARAAFAERCRAAAADPDPVRTHLAVETASGDRHIGWVSRYWVDEKSGWLEVGLDICEADCWGKGFGGEALSLWLDYLFRRLPLRRVGLGTWSGNARMVALAHSLGFRVEARIRRAREVRGHLFDALRFGVLREEWEARRDPAVTEVEGAGCVVALGLDEDEPHLLVVWVRGYADPVLPKGHVRPGETPAGAALRETEEETGYRVILAPVPPKVVTGVSVSRRPWLRHRLTFFLAQPAPADAVLLRDRLAVRGGLGVTRGPDAVGDETVVAAGWLPLREARSALQRPEQLSALAAFFPLEPGGGRRP